MIDGVIVEKLRLIKKIKGYKVTKSLQDSTSGTCSFICVAGYSV